MTSRNFFVIGILSLLVLVVSFFFGRYPHPYFTSLADFQSDEMVLKVVMGIRIPRVLMAFMLGMVLSASGTVFQMVFRNPLVDAGFLGVSSGAAFGASLAIVFMGGAVYAVQISAGTFAFAGLVASYGIAHRIKFGDWVLRLVLAGIAISAIYTAGSGVLKYLADPLRELPEMTFWMLGGLWGMTWPDAVHIIIVAMPCLAVIWLMRWRLNLLSMGDETAFSLIAAPGLERGVVLFAAVISTAAVVSKAGQIGWVGLIMPHIARRIVGSDAQKTLPCAMLIGGFFVLVCDNISRSVFSGEIPLGILTSMIGAGVFIGLMMSPRLTVKKG
ncbi:MAG: iron ABC transporter permease [Deltaproteobacteria bacterium]|nr:iron ABC transporter permease [Deltaproteobacteria bacterium]